MTGVRCGSCWAYIAEDESTWREVVRTGQGTVVHKDGCPSKETGMKRRLYLVLGYEGRKATPFVLGEVCVTQAEAKELAETEFEGDDGLREVHVVEVIETQVIRKWERDDG